MWRSTAWAMAAAALPAPSTIVRPAGGGGRCGSIACAGLGRRDRRLEQLAQQRLALDDPLRRTHATSQLTRYRRLDGPRGPVVRSPDQPLKTPQHGRGQLDAGEGRG